MVATRRILLAAALCFSGCGSDEMPTTAVSGTVTVDGIPATSGLVYFVPLKGPSAAGKLDSEGHFQLSTRSSM